MKIDLPIPSPFGRGRARVGVDVQIMSPSPQSSPSEGRGGTGWSYFLTNQQCPHGLSVQTISCRFCHDNQELYGLKIWNLLLIILSYNLRIHFREGALWATE